MNLSAPPHRPNVEEADLVSYELVSVESAKAPEGCAGRDWFVYRIGQGVNEITGYRQGNRESVRADAETIVVALNERREWRKSKQLPKTRRRTGAPAKTAAAPAAEAADAEAAE